MSPLTGGAKKAVGQSGIQLPAGNAALQAERNLLGGDFIVSGHLVFDGYSAYHGG